MNKGKISSVNHQTIRDWYQDQKEFSSIEEVAKAVGLNYNTFRRQMAGNGNFSKRTLEKLEKITKLNLLDNSEPIKKKVKSPKAPKKMVSLEDHANGVRETLLDLYDQLKAFVNGTEEHRNVLRGSVYTPDLLHIHSLLAAIGSEEELKVWLKMNSYHIKR